MPKNYKPKSRAEVSRNMAAIRSRDNLTELAVGRALHRLGLRYRKHRRDIPGRPDFVFVKARVAVFIDGDYWHGRMLRERGDIAVRQALQGRPNPAYWYAKLSRNVARDDTVSQALAEAGWHVVRVWESEARRSIDDVAARIAAIVRAQR